jgi:hypothetical protein
MILTHESGSQEDQFDKKKWRQKISWDYPFKGIILCIEKKRFQRIKENKCGLSISMGRPLPIMGSGRSRPTTAIFLFSAFPAGNQFPDLQR